MANKIWADVEYLAQILNYTIWGHTIIERETLTFESYVFILFL